MAAYKDEARGTWYVSFHYNDWTGKNKRKLKRGFRTRKEALEYEQKFLLQQATNLDMRFEDFYKLYEEDLKPKLKLNTWRTIWITKFVIAHKVQFAIGICGGVVVVIAIKLFIWIRNRIVS